MCRMPKRTSWVNELRQQLWLADASGKNGSLLSGWENDIIVVTRQIVTHYKTHFKSIYCINLFKNIKPVAVNLIFYRIYRKSQNCRKDRELQSARHWWQHCISMMLMQTLKMEMWTKEVYQYLSLTLGNNSRLYRHRGIFIQIHVYKNKESSGLWSGNVCLLYVSPSLCVCNPHTLSLTSPLICQSS